MEENQHSNHHKTNDAIQELNKMPPDQFIERIKSLGVHAFTVLTKLNNLHLSQITHPHATKPLSLTTLYQRSYSFANYGDYLLKKKSTYSKINCITTQHYSATSNLTSLIISNLRNPTECKDMLISKATSELYENIDECINKNLKRKYLTSMDAHNIKVVNDIIFNEDTHVVSVFKDYLIYDDVNEFLRRFYVNNELRPRLEKVFNFYDKYSKVFPNYVALPESKFMFKNIEKKQKLLDEMQKKSNEEISKDEDTNERELFSPEFLSELNKDDSLDLSQQSCGDSFLNSYIKNSNAIATKKTNISSKLLTDLLLTDSISFTDHKKEKEETTKKNKFQLTMHGKSSVFGNKRPNITSVPTLINNVKENVSNIRSKPSLISLRQLSAHKPKQYSESTAELTKSNTARTLHNAVF
jgi:hypothetical protein